MKVVQLPCKHQVVVRFRARAPTIKGNCMSFFDSLASFTLAVAKELPGLALSGIIGYGSQKKDGSHDHRYNTGTDRTPAQRAGDLLRRD